MLLDSPGAFRRSRRWPQGRHSARPNCRESTKTVRSMKGRLVAGTVALCFVLATLGGCGGSSAQVETTGSPSEITDVEVQESPSEVTDVEVQESPSESTDVEVQESPKAVACLETWATGLPLAAGRNLAIRTDQTVPSRATGRLTTSTLVRVQDLATRKSGTN